MSWDPPEDDAVREQCSHRHRRIVLAVLAAHGRRLTVNDLTKAILKHNHHQPIAESDGELLTEIQGNLEREHLPALETAGLVEFDRERRLVEPTDTFDRIGPQLEAIVEDDPKLDSPVEL